MKNSYKSFSAKAVQHVYQRSKDKGVIFYDDIDRLVFLSIDSVIAQRYGVKVLGISIMFTHLHKSFLVRLEKQMSKYMQDSTSIFARAYNYRHKRKGDVFYPRFGRAGKRQEKKIREHLAYVYNNHVEKGLCKRAIDERWCFLAYAKSSSPFSKPINMENISKRLKAGLRLIDRRKEAGKYLKYSEVIKAMRGLSSEEREQFIDYAISKYLHIDFDAVMAFYGGFDAMVTAFDSSVGAEREMKEEYYSFSDQYYKRIGDILAKSKWDGRVLSSKQAELNELAKDLYYHHNIEVNAIKKYLHI